MPCTCWSTGGSSKVAARSWPCAWSGRATRHGGERYGRPPGRGSGKEGFPHTGAAGPRETLGLSGFGVVVTETLVGDRDNGAVLHHHPRQRAPRCLPDRPGSDGAVRELPG